ncbi:MAG TPA: alpha/beta hydrolase-fold protein [Ideonella sp.]|uniref:alpha/beta hydrolase n=1 Tax=Ideonella sp. TaxID=1929293 RepID=UPI002E36F397|nr:alpha/beta hydrolase-fold protein [Ideonella sp.]HEX5682397.1 alpha/beta hydrolase-fold protein [Ideonella sp.]
MLGRLPAALKNRWADWCERVVGVDDPFAAWSTAAPDAGGRFECFGAWPSRHVAPRRVDVWLPPGYDEPEAGPHAVLYMHDGQQLFDPATAAAGHPWAVGHHVTAQMLAGRMRPTIVVGIWSTERRYAEYAPAAALRRLPAPLYSVATCGGHLPGEPFEALSDAYLRFLVDELKPAIDARYRTRRGLADTAVMGSSMGGLIALNALVAYPEVFGAAGGLSTHWPLSINPALLRRGGDPRLGSIAEAGRAWLAEALPPAGRHRLYFDHGDRHLDALYAPHQRAVDALAVARGYRRGIDLQSRVFPGADHHERAWRARLGPALAWLLPA